MSYPKVSIVVPVYNVEKKIARCLDSILQQTYSNIEIILVDDGSKDSSFSICQTYERSHPSQITLIQQKNAGPATARNVGIDNSNGKYVAFVDSDDYIAPDMIEKMVSAAEGSEAEMVICGYFLESGDQITPSEYMWAQGLYCGDSHKEIALEFVDDSTAKNIPPYSWTRLIQKSVLDNYNLRFTAGLIRSEDYHFWVKVHFQIDRVYMLSNERLYHYVETSNSITQRYIPGYWESVKFIYNDLRNALPDEALVRQKLELMFIRRSLIALNNATKCADRKQASDAIMQILKDPLLKDVFSRLPHAQTKRFGMYAPLMKHHGKWLVHARYLLRNVQILRRKK